MVTEISLRGVWGNLFLIGIFASCCFIKKVIYILYILQLRSWFLNEKTDIDVDDDSFEQGDCSGG